MTTSALSSPSLGSASLPEWTNGISVASPDITPRLVQKQVVRVKGMKSEALIILYLRLAIPTSSITQSFQLFPDDGIVLKSSQVYSVNSSKEGRTVIPPESSRHLQRAAEILGINRSAPPLSFSSLKDSHDTQGESSRLTKKKAKITTSNFHVSLVVPPDSDRLTGSTSQKGDDRCHYIAVVQLTVPFALTPPKWPYMVRIPLSRCLNNYLNFSVDESCAQNNTIVEVDPPLLPKPTPMASAKLKPKNDIEAIEANGEADEDQALSGPFYSTTSLCIRWASADSGVDQGTMKMFGSGHRLIRAGSLEVTANFSRFKRISSNVAEAFLQAQLTLKDIHYPGLDATANVNLQLESPSGSCWKSETISIIPTKQSTSSFRSFSTTHPASSTSVHSLKPGSTAQSRAEQIRSPSPLSSSSAYSEESIDADATLEDGDNLLDVRPPKGLTASDLYSSSDSDQEGNLTKTLTASKPTKTRRYSLGQQLSDGKSSLLHPSRDNNQTLYIALNVAALFQGAEEFICSLEATIQLPLHHTQSQVDGMRVMLPLIKAHGIALKYEVSLQGATYQSSTLGKDVKRNGVDAKRHITLPANPSKAEIHEARIEVMADEVLVNDIAITADPLISSQDDGDESDDIFANISFESKDGQGQMAQIESLSGMIQEASVEVYSTATMQEDLLLTEGAQKTIKTTHVIRSSWPSAPAPSSSSGLCGALLPQIVFALPCSHESELQILCASINGHSVHIEENAESNARSSSSRIIDLQLPESLKGTAKVDFFLLYMQETLSCSSLCLFPPMVSSIADLCITLHYGAFYSQVPDIFFSNQPVSLCNLDSQEGMYKSKTRAHMVPSMTSVSAEFLARVQPLNLAHSTKDDALPVRPLRRMINTKDKSNSRRLFYSSSMGSLFHIICTLILAIAIIGTFISIEPMVGSLSRKVDSLAMALDVDFSEGFWKPEPWNSGGGESAVHIAQTVKKTPRNEEKANKKDEIQHYKVSSEPHELSIDTTSFAMLMHAISLGFKRTISWPFLLIYTIFGRSPSY